MAAYYAGYNRVSNGWKRPQREMRWLGIAIQGLGDSGELTGPGFTFWNAAKTQILPLFDLTLA
jgi:hypothetical protein